MGVSPQASAAALATALVLVAGWAGCSWAAGFPPPTALASWVSAHGLVLSVANECLFLATLAFVVPIVGVARLAGPQPGAHLVATVAAGGGVVTLLVANLALGRLVYPVFGLALGPDGLALAVGLYYGGLHAADLMAAVAAAAWGVARFRATRRPGTLVLPGIVVVAEGASAYPWLFDPTTVLALRVSTVLVGWWTAGRLWRGSQPGATLPKAGKRDKIAP